MLKGYGSEVAGAATVGRFSRRAAISSPASSPGGSAVPRSKASRYSRTQEIWSVSATHSRTRATPPFGCLAGKVRGTGSPPASRTRSGRPRTLAVGTPMRGVAISRGLLGIQLLQEKFPHPSAVGVAAGRPHDLADQEPDHLLVAAPDTLCLLGVGRDDLVHDASELVAAHGGEPQALDDGGGRLAGLEDPVEDILGSGAGDGAFSDEPDQLRHPLGAHLRLGDLDPRLVQPSAQLDRDPVGGLLGIYAGAGGDLLVVDGEVAVGDEHTGVVLGEAVLLHESGSHLFRQLGEAASYLADPGGCDLHRQEIGLGEVAVVVGVLLAPELVYLVVFRVVVERGLLHPAAALQDPALALELAREPPLDEAEGVHVL